VPAAGFWKGRTLAGVEIDVTVPHVFPSVRTAVELLVAARDLGALNFHDPAIFDRDWGTGSVRALLTSAATPEAIIARWSPGLADFAQQRESVLLY
jgi:uncharacterized protein YbbC (DUF1343 family)